MNDNLCSVSSNQSGVHRNLLAVVARHRRHVYQKPIAEHTRDAFRQLQQALAARPRPLVLDSGCGVGESTEHLAARHADCWVIGVDKSARRLARRGAQAVVNQDNAWWVRADLVDFWRLAAAAGWRLQHHYLLYPNPWPKAEHLQRRWHGHPVFPTLMALGGALEARSNWRIYLAELALALRCYCGLQPLVEDFRAEEFITPFERKYARRGESLYRLHLPLPASPQLTPVSSQLTVDG